MRCNGRGLSNGWLSIVIIALILVIDQLLKIEVKTSLSLGSAVKVTDWFYIEFVENNGMAYGMTFFNKLVLSVFRIVAISFIGCFIYRLVKQEHSRGYLVCLSMVLAGAAGNLIDCMFYGLILKLQRLIPLQGLCRLVKVIPHFCMARW